MNKYEALGRYIEAKENYDKAVRMQALFIEQLKDKAEALNNERGSKTATSKNLQALDDLLAQVKQSHQQRQELAEVANQYAELCEKPKV